MWRNTEQQFGLVTIAVHWLMAVTVIGLFCVGVYMVELDYYHRLYRVLPFAHKSTGILLAAVLVFRLAWRLANPHVRPAPGVGEVESRVATAVHWLFYALLALMVTSGYLISTADGSSINVFGWFAVPATVTGIERQEDVAGVVHEYTAYLLITLVAVHAGAALKHHFIDRDATLSRMLGRRAPGT